MSFRKQKIQELIRRIVSETLIKEVQDPRIGFVTITGVELSKDYSLAEVGVSVMGTKADIRRALSGLQSASGYIQHVVNKNIRMRQVPKIKFVLDPSIADGTRLVSLLENLEGVSSSEGEGEDDRE